MSKLPDPAHVPVDAATESFAEAVGRWQSYRVRTLDTKFGTGDGRGDGEIEAFFETVAPALWAKVRSAGRKDKPLLGYRFASNTPIPLRVVELWRLLRHDLGLVHKRGGVRGCALCDELATRLEATG